MEDLEKYVQVIREKENNLNNNTEYIVAVSEIYKLLNANPLHKELLKDIRVVPEMFSYYHMFDKLYDEIKQIVREHTSYKTIYTIIGFILHPSYPTVYKIIDLLTMFENKATTLTEEELVETLSAIREWGEQNEEKWKYE